MKFGTRLTLFFTVTLLAIVLSTGLAIRSLLRDTLIEDGKIQVAVSEARFGRQLSELGDSLAEGVRLLTLDFALRRSIADRDAATVLSALRNHGRRIGATRMILSGTDGAIAADTTESDASATMPFPYPALLERAGEDGSAASVAVIDKKPVWLVVVPVMAPDPIGFIAAAIPLDDAQLSRLRDLIGLPGQLSLATGQAGAWRRLAGTVGTTVPRYLPPSDGTATIANVDGDETIVFTRILATPRDSPPVMAIIEYPVSEAVRRYLRILYGLVPALTLGLLAALFGLAMIARGVSRPIEDLARQTKRIAAGDYTAPEPLRRHDELGQLSVALSDMTHAISEREDRILHQATHDPVTGLANRDALAAAIDQRPINTRGAILVIAFTRWRDATRTVGREVGDRLMRASAVRICAQFPENTPIGAIGESSFAVFLEGADADAATQAAAFITDSFEVPYQEGELTIDTPVAVGISVRPDHGTEAVHLLRRGEIALMSALSADTHTALYLPAADPHRPERLSLMSDLRGGLMRGEFELVYQPKLDLRHNTIDGAEALVRWNHPTRGRIQPDDFIALAEETGNIQHLTRWALRTGLTEAARWRSLGIDIRIAINLSVRDLTDDTLPRSIAGLLREAALPARALVLEVTESAIMGEPEAALAVLRLLEEQGIDLAVDDFGVGQSSLAYLRRLPVREIKLDKSFVQELHRNIDDQIIVRLVVELAHGLGYRVTAEGVEDDASLALLRSFGCDYAQGYFIARPLPVADFQAFVSGSHAFANRATP